MTHATVFAFADAAARRASIAALTAAVALLASLPAQAIERCRIEGRLVLQSGPCPQASAPRSPLVDAASVEEGPKRTIAEVMREREAAIRARPAKRETAPIDGASILPARMGAW